MCTIYTVLSTPGQLLLGVVLILLSQLVVASQMVIEEMFIKKHNVPPIQVYFVNVSIIVLY